MRCTRARRGRSAHGRYTILTSSSYTTVTDQKSADRPPVCAAVGSGPMQIRIDHLLCAAVGSGHAECAVACFACFFPPPCQRPVHHHGCTSPEFSAGRQALRWDAPPNECESECGTAFQLARAVVHSLSCLSLGRQPSLCLPLPQPPHPHPKASAEAPAWSPPASLHPHLSTRPFAR